MIITLARQRGSGAAQIGKSLAAEFSLPVYNLRELINLAKGKGLLAQYPEFFFGTAVEQSALGYFAYGFTKGSKGTAAAYFVTVIARR